RVVDLIEENGGNTQYLSTGSLGGLVASWRKSPEVLSKVRRILISGVSVDQGVLNGLSDPDGAAGELLLSTTTPLVLFPKSMTESLVFDKEDLGVLGKGRTDLTDAMTYLASRDLDQGALALDPIPMVTYAYIPSSAKLEPKDLSFTNTVGRTTQALVAVDIAREAMVDNLILELANPLIDFSLGFSHYLFGLGRLSPDSKKEISQKLRNLPAPEEVRDASALASERIRRILDYLDSSLEVIQSVKEDPAAKEVIESLNETSRRVGSIGWQFPDNFYSKWGVEVQPNGEFQMDIGLSNPYNREIQNIQFEIKVQDEIISNLEIESATGEVPFKVDARIPEGMTPQVSSVGEIAASVHFEISDVTVQTTRLIPIVVKP
ncbi:MAG: hypothetical protein KC917_14735, partial [Candidatus Omnitrophica bacterium]|nr:hypothetical protein [Candidatus Omnitrophota bacterium]